MEKHTRLICYNFAPRKRRRKIPEALVYFDISFSELQGLRLSTGLTVYDKMVYLAAAALYDAGNMVITTNQIYRLLGGKSKANSRDRERVLASLKKMSHTLISYDDEHASRQFRKETYHKYQGHLLEARFGEQVHINGTLIADAVCILAEPPLTVFARHMGQYTTISTKVFSLPLSNTGMNLAIKDYLLVNLPAMKSGRLNNRMLWTSLYRACHVDRNKCRVRTAVTRCLDYLKSDDGCHYIHDYRVDADGVTVFFRK